MEQVSKRESTVMKTLFRLSLLCSVAIAISACANPPPPQKKTATHKKLKLETIDHGPMRPKTYLYREVDEPASR
jgi:hypothetical protein